MLSGDDVPLDVNNPEHPAVISVVNNPKYDASFSPVIATIIHTIVKQMSVRHRESSFLMLEEAASAAQRGAAVVGEIRGHGRRRGRCRCRTTRHRERR